MSEFDCERALPCEKDCPRSFAQNHSALLLTEWLNRRRRAKQPPSPVGVAQEPIDFFRPDDKAIVNRLICHQVFGHFYRREPNRSVADQGISGVSNTENRREMARRGVKHRFWKQERTSLLRAGLDRKSTRLNSSHGSISYAVFCLKKKTITSSTPTQSTMANNISPTT